MPIWLDPHGRQVGVSQIDIMYVQICWFLQLLLWLKPLHVSLVRGELVVCFLLLGVLNCDCWFLVALRVLIEELWDPQAIQWCCSIWRLELFGLAVSTKHSLVWVEKLILGVNTWRLKIFGWWFAILEELMVFILVEIRDVEFVACGCCQWGDHAQGNWSR